MSFDPKETSVLDDATLILASASEGEPLSLAPTAAAMMCVSPPQTELDLSYLLAVVKQLTQWLHVVNTLVDSEQKKLCGVLGALSALQALTQEMADQDQNKTPELFAACQKLNQQALSKCRAGDGPPSILVLDKGLDDLYKNTTALLQSVLLDRHGEKLSSIIGDSDTEKKAIRDPYASIMDKSFDDIVNAYVNDQSIPQETREERWAIFLAGLSPAVGELAKTPKFGALVSMAEGALEHPEKKDSAFAVALQSMAEAGLKAVGPEGLVLALLEAVALARMKRAATDFQTEGQPAIDFIMKYLIPAMHLKPEKEQLLRKDFDDIITTQDSILKEIALLPKATPTWGTDSTDTDTRFLTTKALENLEHNAHIRDFKDAFAVETAHQNEKAATKYFDEETSPAGRLELTEHAQTGSFASSALTIFAVVQIISAWKELEEAFDDHAVDKVEFGKRLTAFNAFTTGVLEGCPAGFRVTGLLADRLAIRLGRDLLKNSAEFMGEVALKGVPFLTIIQGGLDALDGIAEGKPEQVVVGGVTMTSGTALWIGMSGLAEAGFIGLSAAAWTGVGTALFIGAEAYLIWEAIEEALKPATQLYIEQLVTRLELKNEVQRCRDGNATDHDNAWLSRRGDVFVADEPGHSSVLGLEAEFAEVEKCIDGITTSPVMAQRGVAGAPTVGWHEIVVKDVDSKVPVRAHLKKAGFTDEITFELVWSQDEIDGDLVHVGDTGNPSQSVTSGTIARVRIRHKQDAAKAEGWKTAEAAGKDEDAPAQGPAEDGGSGDATVAPKQGTPDSGDTRGPNTGQVTVPF